jgi:hypothetical protein
MAPILTPEDVVRRIAAECVFVDERGAVGIRLKPAAAIVRAVRKPIRSTAAEAAASDWEADRTKILDVDLGVLRKEISEYLTELDVKKDEGNLHGQKFSGALQEHDTSVCRRQFEISLLYLYTF